MASFVPLTRSNGKIVGDNGIMKDFKKLRCWRICYDGVSFLLVLGVFNWVVDETE